MKLESGAVILTNGRGCCSLGIFCSDVPGLCSLLVTWVGGRGKYESKEPVLIESRALVSEALDRCLHGEEGTLE